MKNFMQKILFFTLFFSIPSTFAYYSVLETGSIVKAQRVTASPQVIISGDDGANISGRYDFNINEEMSGRALVGLGEVDVFVGASAKWIPIPDYENQPAFGLITGLFYADYDDEDIVTLRLAPIASKQLDTQIGLITPYVSLPFGISFYDSQSDSPVNLVLGSEMKIASLDTVNFIFELGLKLNNDSFSYITVGAAWDFE